MFLEIEAFSVNIKNKQKRLDELNSEYLQIKAHPTFDFTKTKMVKGIGNINSPIVFLGEGPGAKEDELGEPFVGKSGKLLTALISTIGLLRDNVYITNVVKCRLENNRPPRNDEIEYEKKVILDKELKIINPKIICTLGASATKALLGLNCKIAQVRGSLISCGEKWVILPLYHPAYLMRKPSAKQIFLDDLKNLCNFME